MESLEQLLLDAKPLTEHEDKVLFNPSMLWALFSCPRRAFFDWTDPLSDDRDWQLTADHGNAIHSMLVDRIKKAGLWAGDEVRGSDNEIGLSYRIDCLIKDPTNDGKIVPVEIKSCGVDYRGNSLFDKYVLEPNRSHVLQLMTYLGCHRPEHYEFGYLLYYDKCRDRIRFVKIPYDDVLFKSIMEKVTMHHLAVRTEEMPIMAESDYECKYCPYKDRCVR